MAASSGARHTRAAVRTHCPTTNQIQGLRQGTHSMKPQTEKPSEQVMRFFTPELFIKFNSPDDVVADRADEDWETAIREYRSHLEGLRNQMPSQVKKLAGLSLHDAEILACELPIERFLALSDLQPFPFWFGFAILSVKQGDEIFSLFYVLWDRVRRHQSIESWPFSKLRTHWLYDEVDVAPIGRGMFLHRVLLSDGTVIEIPFVSALIHNFPLQEGRQSDASRIA